MEAGIGRGQGAVGCGGWAAYLIKDIEDIDCIEENIRTIQNPSVQIQNLSKIQNCPADANIRIPSVSPK